jgi:uncharacterized membrane protein
LTTQTNYQTQFAPAHRHFQACPVAEATTLRDVVSAFPAVVTAWGGQQSARTVHFFVSIALVVFLLVHIAMVILAGFSERMRAMITGRTAVQKEHA